MSCSTEIWADAVCSDTRILLVIWCTCVAKYTHVCMVIVSVVIKDSVVHAASKEKEHLNVAFRVNQAGKKKTDAPQ